MTEANPQIPQLTNLPEAPAAAAPATVKSPLLLIVGALLLAAVAGAGGYFLGVQQGAKKAPVAAVEESTVAQPSTVSDETSMPADEQIVDQSEWVTYTNTVYGYSFQYPANWQVMDQDTQNIRTPATSESQNIIVYDPAKYVGTENSLATFSIIYVGMNNLENNSPVDINGISMYRQDTMHGEIYHWNIPDTDQYLGIYGAGGHTADEEHNQIVRQMFASFQVN